MVVFSTGYDATDGLIPYDVRGRDGVRLADVWHEFPRAYLGTTVPGFPNFFVVTGPNTGIGHTSAIFVIESQMEYLLRAIGAVVDAGRREHRGAAPRPRTPTPRPSTARWRRPCGTTAGAPRGTSRARAA